MAATIEIRSYHGTSPDAGTNIASGSFRFKLADNDTVDAVTPIAAPPSGTNYSWIKQMRFYVGATPPANAIGNLKFYSDGANGLGTGLDIVVKTNAAYVNPVTQAGTALTGVASIFTYTSGSPLAVTGSITSSSTNTAFGDYMEFQMSVASTAGPGNSASETLTWSYDES